MNNFIVRLISGFILNKEKRRNFRKKYLRAKLSIGFRFILSKYHNNNRIIIIRNDGTQIVNPRFQIKGLNINWGGANSILKIHESCNFNNCHIFFGNNNVIEIGASNHNIDNLDVCFKMSDNSKIIIGTSFSCVGVKIFLHDEPNNNIKIGNDCMFSFDIVLWPSDGYTIYDTDTKEVLNSPQKGITIGNHCWIGRSTTFLKDSGISDNTIVGTCSVITKYFNETNCIIAGLPSKLIKNNVNWDRDNTFAYKLKGIK